MSAREDIEGWFSPGIRRAVSRELDRYRDEVLREAAEEIRTWANALSPLSRAEHIRHEVRAARNMADLIDPDKEKQ